MRYEVVLLIFVLTFPNLGSGGSFDEDDFGSDQFGQYMEKTTQVSYGSITIDCHYGCGDPGFDSAYNRISSILNKTIHSVFRLESPLFLCWAPFEQSRPYPFSPWIRDWTDYSVYDWRKARGFYLAGNPRKTYSIASYPQFLELAAALRDDVRFYSLDVNVQELNFYRSTLKKLRVIEREGEYGHIAFTEDGQLELYDWGTWTGNTQNIDDLIRQSKSRIKELNELLADYYPSKYETKKEIVELAIQKIDIEFREIFAWCLEHHQPEGIAFKEALEGLMGGDYYDALDQVRWMIQTAEKHNVHDELLSKLYLLKGRLQSEYGLYAEAVIGLTEAIQKNRGLKEAYFERAAAYFELGQFDKSIEDYLSSNIRPSYFESPTQLGLGVAAGVLVGVKDSALEFIPTMIGTAKGLGAGVWALTKNPAAASREFVNAATQCIEYIRSNSPAEIVQEMVPELKELVQNYNSLDDFQRGLLIGHVIGKYGMDIFLAKQSVTFIKSYQDLKRANRAMTLDALAVSGKTEVILAETDQRWTNLHIEALRKGEVKVVEAKQGKHILGHMNYEQLISQGKNPSILVHPNPDQLIQKFAGTGAKDIGDIPGMAGYMEIVDFKEFIGYSVQEATGVKTPTTLGKIHYAKNGVHIVPYVKRVIE